MGINVMQPLRAGTKSRSYFFFKERCGGRLAFQLPRLGFPLPATLKLVIQPAPVCDAGSRRGELVVGRRNVQAPISDVFLTKAPDDLAGFSVDAYREAIVSEQQILFRFRHKMIDLNSSRHGDTHSGVGMWYTVDVE